LLEGKISQLYNVHMQSLSKQTTSSIWRVYDGPRLAVSMKEVQVILGIIARAEAQGLKTIAAAASDVFERLAVAASTE
jgi:hypothetical protein